MTVVIFNNRAYRILKVELERVGADPPVRKPMPSSTSAIRISISSDSATGFGVPARRADTGEELVEALESAVAEPGPHLIEVLV